LKVGILIKKAKVELSSAARTNKYRGHASTGSLRLLRRRIRAGNSHKTKINNIGAPENGATIAPVKEVNKGNVVSGSPTSAKTHRASREMK